MTDYRSVLARRGDVEIGVGAQRRRRRNIVLALLGVVLIVGAGWIYRSLGTHDGDDERGERYKVKVRCISEGCGYVGIISITADQSGPLKCPECGQRSCRQLWQCRACGAEFLPGGREGPIRCPNCGSTSVGSAVPPGP